MILGEQTWVFDNNPIIISTGVVGGPHEANGAISEDFDHFSNDLWDGEKSFEKAEAKLLEHACNIALNKANLTNTDVQAMLCGDLLNQIIASSFAARNIAIPYIGLYGACSTSMLGLTLAAMMVNSGYAKKVLAATSSHNAASEKQYRYPTEYGAQKPPTAQWTVTGAGAAIVADNGIGPKVTMSTIGKVIDMGCSDPFNMGEAMAPAAVDTIYCHLNDTGRSIDYYDLVITGDLGRVGHTIATQLLNDRGIQIPENKFVDCGMKIYKEEQKVFAGGSGCACCAVTTYGHFLSRMKRGELKKILVTATGALLSPMSYQQRESIPSVAHSVCIEI